MATRIRVPRHLLLLLVAAGILASCGPAAMGGQGRNPDLIGQADIAEANASTALDLVQRLRPQWLRARSQSFDGGVGASVYVDDVRFGDLDSLRSISAQTVQEIEWIDSGEATQRWGTGNMGGAILVRTRRGS